MPNYNDVIDSLRSIVTGEPAKPIEGMEYMTSDELFAAWHDALATL